MLRLIPVLVLFLTACSSVPTSISDSPEPDWQLSQIKGKANQQANTVVRWGGKIVRVENDEMGSTIHIVQLPLNSFGRPIRNDYRDSQGRFLAKTAKFIDPSLYQEDMLVTVAGQVVDEQKVLIDKKSMDTPVIDIQNIYLWNERQRSYGPYDDYDYYYPPRWRSSWYFRRGVYW